MMNSSIQPLAAAGSVSVWAITPIATQADAHAGGADEHERLAAPVVHRGDGDHGEEHAGAVDDDLL